MEKHYVCEGKCGGVSNTPGVCKAGDCSNSDQELKECDCDTKEHLDKVDSSNSSDLEDSN